MLNFLSRHAVRNCDADDHSPTRRELLRIGSLGIGGIALPHFFAWQANAANAAAAKYAGSKNFGAAKNCLMIFLQGGPSHIDIWDPKPDAPANIRGEFKPIPTKIKGTFIGEHMPMMAQALDKATLIRSMSYTPSGLFNHTAAIYQMLTGYPPDKVSPSGQLEPPNSADFPTAGSHISKLKPMKEPVLPFVELPRPLQESGIIGKGGAAGFLGKAYDPYRMYQDPAETVKLEDLALRKEIPPERLRDRFELLKGINGSMRELEKALDQQAVDEYYGKAYDLVLSGKARDAMDLSKEQDSMRDRYGRYTFGQSLLMGRRLIEAGTKFVQVNWPSVANGDPEKTAWDTHAANFGPLKNLHCPKLDRSLSALLEDMDQRGLLKETLVVCVGEFGRSPRMGVSTSGNSNSPDGRDHWPIVASMLMAGGGLRHGQVIGSTEPDGGQIATRPVHAADLAATIYQYFGVPLESEYLDGTGRPVPIVYNGAPIAELFY